MELETYIETTEFFRIGKKTTVCLLTLHNGFEIVATSACLDEKNYKQEVGEAISKELALQKLYEYLTIKSALDFKRSK